MIKKTAKSVKAKQVAQLFECTPAEDKEQQKCAKAIITNLSKLIVGLKGNISKMFHQPLEEISTKSFKFTEAKYEDEIMPAIEENYPDYATVIDRIKGVYDWSVLVEILDGEDYLSFAKVKAYEKHGKNLHILKNIMKKYCKDEVYQAFLMESTKKWLWKLYWSNSEEWLYI